MPSLWGYTEPLCARQKCPLPFGWLASPVAEGQDPCTRRKEAKGVEAAWGCRLIGCRSEGSVLGQHVGDPGI